MICPLTGNSVEFTKYSNSINYDLTIAGNDVTINLCPSCFKNIDFKDTYHLVAGLIANKKWSDLSFVKLNSCTNTNIPDNNTEVTFPEILNTADYPKTPKEKMDSFFLRLFNLQTVDGQSIPVDYKKENIWVKNYFKTHEECSFYLQGLKEKGWVYFDRTKDSGFSLQITHLGLNMALELQDDGKNSNNCFVAMAFKDETELSREAIKKALENTGFNAIIIDDENIDSDKTIPDAIFAAIKKSKFCIADFSLHSKGVYFESGFALGLGMPVIYMCNKNDTDAAHFEIKQLQQIRYSSPEELTKMLTDKIEAWIK